MSSTQANTATAIAVAKRAKAWLTLPRCLARITLYAHVSEMHEDRAVYLAVYLNSWPLVRFEHL